MDTEFNPCPPEELVIRENFKKDYKLSCPVLDDNDCFAKSLKIWDLEEDWTLYKGVMTKYPDFDDFRKQLRNQIVQRIQAVPGFDKLIAPVPKRIWEGPRSYLQQQLSGKRLLSIDLTKGNFQSLKYLGNKYVLGAANYDQFIRMFTNEEALIKSKYFRQMVFGLLNPDLQRATQSYMLAHIISRVKKAKDYMIVHLTSDEVVFVIESDQDIQLINNAIHNLPYEFRIEEFKIQHIPNAAGEPWFVRYDEKHKENPRLMSVHVRYLFQVYNHVKKIPHQKKDFYWRECGRLAVLLEPEKFID